VPTLEVNIVLTWEKKYVFYSKQRYENSPKKYGLKNKNGMSVNYEIDFKKCKIKAILVKLKKNKKKDLKKKQKKNK
jgi:hypothetical protein